MDHPSGPASDAPVQGLAREAMEDRADDLLQLPDGFKLADPVEINPFHEGDVRREFWERATREAEEEVCQLNEAFMRARPSTLREIVGWRIGFFIVRYDIWAKRGVRVVLGDDMIPPWDQWLANYANETLKAFKARAPLDETLKTFEVLFPQESPLQKLREALIAKREHWRAEGRRNVAIQKDLTPSSRAARDPDRADADEANDGGVTKEDQTSAGQAELQPSGPKMLANAQTRKRRYAFLKKYRADHNHNSMGDLARHFGLSVTAIQGMVRGVRTRYSEETLAKFLNSIGVSPSEW